MKYIWCKSNSNRSGRCRVPAEKGFCFVANELDVYTGRMAVREGCLVGELASLICYSYERHAKTGELRRQAVRSLMMSCCSGNSYCNRNLTLANNSTNFDYDLISYWWRLICPCVVLTVVLLAVVLIQIIKSSMYKRWEDRDSDSSGTWSSRMPRLSNLTLIQSNVNHDLVFQTLVGRGSFGDVWKALLRKNLAVAAKVMSSSHADVWRREVETYSFIRHPNILTFIFADLLLGDDSVKYLIVTEYLDRRSLRHHLTAMRQPLTVEACLGFISSMTGAIDYLHAPILRSNGHRIKPRIFHGDLKTENILVRSSEAGHCVICDFGMSSNEDEWSRSPFIIGSKRYSSPELLSSQQTSRLSFEHCLAADVYAISLCAWECLNRTMVEGMVSQYKMPYEDRFPDADIDIDDLREHVVDNQTRPSFPQHVYHDKRLGEICHLLELAWSPISNGRIGSHLLNKKIIEIGGKNKNMFV